MACFTTFAILSICAVAQTLIWVKLDPLTGTVVRYNKPEMTGSVRGDLIVKIAHQNRFVRLIYCQSGRGLDTPANTRALPREMTTGRIQPWKFGVHEPQTEWERFTCGNIPTILKRGKRPMEVIVEKGTPFVPTPGKAGVQVPKLETLPCYVIGKWSLANGSTD